LSKVKIEVIIEDNEVKTVADAIIRVLRTGRHDDGEIIILPTGTKIRICTGERS